METRTEAMKTKSHHRLVNNLGKSLAFFSLGSSLWLSRTSQAGALTMCQGSAPAEVLLVLASQAAEDPLATGPPRLQTWPGTGCAWGLVLPP